MKKKLFIAIEPPEKIKDHLFLFRADLPVRWMPKENIHLTLFFIGYLNEKLINEIKNVLAVATKNVKSFSLKIDGLKYAPPGSYPPKMIWATIKDSDSLKELKKIICEALSAEINEFLPHITLARTNAWKFNQLDQEEIPDLPEENISFKVNSICLMESKIVKGKTKYQLIEKFKLK